MRDEALPDVGSPARALQDVLLETETIEDFLRELGVMAARAMGGHASVGVTVVRDGRPTTVASSDTRAASLDEVQYRHGGGPCLAAIRTSRPVGVLDLRGDRRLGEPYHRTALEHGVAAVLAVPLRTASGTVGALNAYFGEPLAPGAAELDALVRYADEAARALALSLRLIDQVELNQQLRHALVSRATIDQAIGVIMARQRCPPDEAFARLRELSQHRNIKLRTVAEEIVADVRTPPPEPPRD